MNMDSSYIKDLQIFLAVVNANGVSNAQSVLNKDASAISRSLNTLETRLGLILCERGRQGFKITPEGSVIIEQTQVLFGAFRSFENNVMIACGQSASRLSIGIIDNIITDDNCPLQSALNRIHDQFSSDFELAIHTKSPHRLEKLLLNKEIDIALGIFDNHHRSLNYSALYSETDYLYCASHNPVARLLEQGGKQKQLIDCIRTQNFCARSFLNEADIKCLGFQLLGKTTFTSNLEAITFLILSGSYIGFIPHHFAQRFVDEGKLTPILASTIKRVSTLELVHRRDEDKNSSVLKRALELLRI